ncbi:hypothetical protein HZU75_02550 [Chitinibacter fontanus]|uniref:Glycosyltransferase family 2 protein n=1 Tax=Chitinibacter fontanus TaxID=1737446 RepID=A0A7D5ZET5_9NEIS|nr:hypothetical protein [Chitinibacter fontanus]QLI80509.1 hypothetical protein HZU75_02550 [Chitinibacter fontanus]
MSFEETVCLVVNSCDKYNDVWIPFFSALSDKWPDCKCKILLNTETMVFHWDGLDIKTLQLDEAEKEIPWGARLKKAVALTDTEFILMLFDDYLLEEMVDVAEINRCYEFMKIQQDIAAIYFLNSGISVEQSTDLAGYDLVKQNSDYKINSAPALWRRKHLENYIGDIDTPWAWEFFGSARAFKTVHKFYAISSNALSPFVYQYDLGGAIHRGKWVEKVITNAINRYGLNLDLSNRGVSDGRSYPHSFSWRVKFVWLGYRMIGFDIFIFIKNALEKRVKRLIKRGFL